MPDAATQAQGVVQARPRLTPAQERLLVAASRHDGKGYIVTAARIRAAEALKGLTLLTGGSTLCIAVSRGIAGRVYHITESGRREAERLGQEL